jgi:hypothetical protein
VAHVPVRGGGTKKSLHSRRICGEKKLTAEVKKAFSESNSIFAGFRQIWNRVITCHAALHFLALISPKTQTSGVFAAQLHKTPLVYVRPKPRVPELFLWFPRIMNYKY